MAGLVPTVKTWMPGTRPGMTKNAVVPGHGRSAQTGNPEVTIGIPGKSLLLNFTL
jgi:hypothetical protein